MRLRVAGFGRSEIPFDMFDVAREAADAKRADKMANEMLWKEMGIKRPPSRDKVEAGVDAISELLFPEEGRKIGWRGRFKAMRRVWRAGGFDVAPASLIPPEVVALDTTKKAS